MTRLTVIPPDITDAELLADLAAGLRSPEDVCEVLMQQRDDNLSELVELRTAAECDHLRMLHLESLLALASRAINSGDVKAAEAFDRDLEPNHLEKAEAARYTQFTRDLRRFVWDIGRAVKLLESDRLTPGLRKDIAKNLGELSDNLTRHIDAAQSGYVGR